MKFYDYSDHDWQRIERDWTAWWNGTLNRPLIHLITRDKNHPPGDVHNNLVRFPIDTPIDQILDHYEPFFAAINYHGDAFPQWWLNAGPGIMAAYLGSKVTFSENGGWGTTWFAPLDVASLSEIDPQFDPENDWWQHTQVIMQAAIDRWGDRVVFGHTDIGGNLDILASMRGTTELLFDLTDAPEEVDRLTCQLTNVWIRYYDEMQAILDTAPLFSSSHWASFWSPGTGYMLQSDFCYMISPAMFERFVLPDLTTCCQHLEYPFYHLDGKGQLPHLEKVLEIPNLRGIQWQPGDGQPPADGWLDVLARIRDAGKLCQVYVKRDGAFKIVHELGGEGFQFQMVGENLTDDEAVRFVDQLLTEAT